MTYRRFMKIGILLLITIGLSACSLFSQKHKNNTRDITDNPIEIPPSLAMPASIKNTNTSKRTGRKPIRYTPKKQASSLPSNNNYYIVVGTYPNKDQALDTFVRLSSIGLSGAAMESRQTKAGKVLHMVRLGPYTKQVDIDKTKDTLTGDGLSQFKVVKD